MNTNIQRGWSTPSTIKLSPNIYPGIVVPKFTIDDIRKSKETHWFIELFDFVVFVICIFGIGVAVGIIVGTRSTATPIKANLQPPPMMFKPVNDNWVQQ